MTRRSNRLYVGIVLLATGFSSCTGPIPQYMEASTTDASDVPKILEGIRNELGSEFIVEPVAPHFFVASNDGRRSLDACKSTISRVHGYLASDFFTLQPKEPIRVYLFSDRKSYEEYCRRTYGRPPSTPFGFYMSDERKMVMDISTGTGTLAHELVHPLLAEDFPQVPAWFNEGFASLFEQSRATSDGKMEGLVNWRLPALQRTLGTDEYIPLERILKTTPAEFYGDHRGLHYAAARYFCLYLQEKGLLRAYYNAFRNGVEEEATGIAALKEATESGLEEFEKAWQRWVRDLHWK